MAWRKAWGEWANMDPALDELAAAVMCHSQATRERNYLRTPADKTAAFASGMMRRINPTNEADEEVHDDANVDVDADGDDAGDGADDADGNSDYNGMRVQMQKAKDKFNRKDRMMILKHLCKDGSPPESLTNAFFDQAQDNKEFRVWFNTWKLIMRNDENHEPETAQKRLIMKIRKSIKSMVKTGKVL